jgi:hypothetical protein
MAARTAGVAAVTITSTVEPHQFVGQRLETCHVVARPTVLDNEITANNSSQLAHPSNESFVARIGPARRLKNPTR